VKYWYHQSILSQHARNLTWYREMLVNMAAARSQVSVVWNWVIESYCDQGQEFLTSQVHWYVTSIYFLADVSRNLTKISVGVFLTRVPLVFFFCYVKLWLQPYLALFDPSLHSEIKKWLLPQHLETIGLGFLGPPRLVWILWENSSSVRSGAKYVALKRAVSITA